MSLLSLPALDAEVFKTNNGTLYLKEPGVVMLSAPYVDISGMKTFLEGFDPELEFPKYLDDPNDLNSADQLIKVSGQLCYESFGPKRSWNKDADKYFTNIKASSHGSVLECANFSFLFYGISRSLTHELVRHRVGTHFSQASQRYIDGSRLRFVERPEYQNDKYLHTIFVDRIDEIAEEYEYIAKKLLELQKDGNEILSADKKTDLRKKVNQVARSILPNETEAPIVMTGNVRSWRHIIEMRASEHAETEIRRLAIRVYKCLLPMAPHAFSDYTIKQLGDGTEVLDTPFRKV